MAAMGMIVGGMTMPSAKAADLGGACCADLEQRVAELEATTARTGTRRMRVIIEGQVDKIIMWWDDGQSSKTYYGLENANATTRFTIHGDAKVTGDVRMGFEVTLDNQAGSSSGVTQWDANAKSNDVITVAAESFTGNNNDNYFGAARRMFVWVEDERLGRIAVGRNYLAGAVTTIDLAGISAGASDSLSQINGSFLLRGPAGQYYDVAWKNLTVYSTNPVRQNEVRYDSPSIAGFIYSASIADDGSNYGTMLRYLGETSGFRVAAGIGYEHFGQVAAQQNCVPVAGACFNAAQGFGPANQANQAPNVNAWAMALSLLHVPTGLFVQGHYIAADFDENAPTTVAPGNGFWFQNKAGRIPADQWLIQGGITKNWFGFGNTSVFGEYSRNTGWGAGGGPQAPNGIDYSASTTPGAQSVFGVSDTELTMFGFGIQQNVDAAATELFLDARHFSAGVTCSATGANCTGASAPIGSVPLQKLQTEDFWAVIGGALVKF